MSKPLNPALFAVVGRDLLIGLEWAPAERKAYWRSYWATSALAIATELCKTHPIQMSALRDKIETRPAPKPAAVASRAAVPPATIASYAPAVDAQAAQARAAQKDFISSQMGTGRHSPHAVRSTTWDPKTCVQQFGVAVANDSGRR